MLSLLCNDVILDVASWLGVLSLLRLGRTSKHFFILIHKIEALQKKCEPVVQYKQLVQQRRWEKGLMKAIKNSDWEMIHFFIHKGACVWYKALQKAAEGGEGPIFQFFLDKCRDVSLKWNCLLRGAAKGGHVDLIEQYMDKEPFVNWSKVARCAAKGGHKELAERLLKKGSRWEGKWMLWYNPHTSCGCKFWDTKTSQYPLDMHSINQPLQRCCLLVGLRKAVRTGNKEQIHFFSQQENFPDICGPFIALAAYYGSQEILQVVKEKYMGKFDHTWRDWGRVLSGAANGGHIEVVSWALQYARQDCFEKQVSYLNFTTFYHFYRRTALNRAANRGHRDIVDLLLQTPLPIHSGWVGAISGGVMDLVHQLKKCDPNFNIEIALQRAARSGQIELVEYFIEQGATGLDDALHQTFCCCNHHTDVARYLISKGAKFRSRGNEQEEPFINYISRTSVQNKTHNS